MMPAANRALWRRRRHTDQPLHVVSDGTQRSPRLPEMGRTRADCSVETDLDEVVNGWVTPSVARSMSLGQSLLSRRSRLVVEADDREGRNDHEQDGRRAWAEDFAEIVNEASSSSWPSAATRSSGPFLRRKKLGDVSPLPRRSLGERSRHLQKQQLGDRRWMEEPVHSFCPTPTSPLNFAHALPQLAPHLRYRSGPTAAAPAAGSGGPDAEFPDGVCRERGRFPEVAGPGSAARIPA